VTPSSESARTPGSPPAWYRLTPYLGRPPALTPRQWRLLALVSLVSLFEQYDVYLFSLNLSHIQRELGIDEGQLGLLGGIVRAGAFGAVLLSLAADRFGRRRILLLTVLAYTVLTGATAFAPNAAWFVVCQTLARAFASAETLLAVVVIAEEFEAQHRGWGIGALGAITSIGAGLAAVLFGFVDSLPGGWRALYLVGLAPLLVLAWLRRSMTETERYLALERERQIAPQAVLALGSVASLLRSYPGRLLAVAGSALLIGLSLAPATFFAPKYLQDSLGWSPAAVAGLNIGGGSFAMIGNPLSGWLGDRWGRRPVASVFAVLAGIAAVALYTSSGAIAGLLWVLLIFGINGVEVTLAACAAELFPTSQRSTASGVRAFAATLGVVLGLAGVSVLRDALGSSWSAVIALATLALPVPLLVLLAFPETAGRALEDIAPERPAGA